MTGPRIAVVGGGIIGAAVAQRLMTVDPSARVVVLEKEGRELAVPVGRAQRVGDAQAECALL